MKALILIVLTLTCCMVWATAGFLVGRATKHQPRVKCQGAISAAGPTVVRNGKIIIEAHESGVIYFPHGCKP